MPQQVNDPLHPPLHPAPPQPPRMRYLGYLQRPAGRPVLLFDRGFLVQDDIDPAKCGWYACDAARTIPVALNDHLATSLLTSHISPDMLAKIHRILRDQYAYEAVFEYMGQPVPPDPARVHFVLIDQTNLEHADETSFYLFLNTHLVRATDPACAPAWKTAPALQALGPLDPHGEPIAPAHVNLVVGMTRFAANRAPVYIGYVQSGNQAPTLFFDTGFLVQASRNAAAVGWHAYQHPFQLSANMGEGFDSGMTAYNMTPAMWDIVNQHVSAAMIEQALARLPVPVAPEAGNHYVLIDSPRIDIVSQASFHVFGGPIMRLGDPGFSPNFNAAYAAHALGALDAAGVPTQRPHVAATVGFVSVN